MAVRSLLLAALVVAACAPATVHPPNPAAAPTLPAKRAEEVWSRATNPAEGVTVHATLWDASLVASAQTKGEPRRAWTRRYLERTAFTVVVELEDRHPVLDVSPLLAPSGWDFGLALNKGDDAPSTDLIAPAQVDLLVVDRFPTESGAHHHRVAMAVFFDGTLYDAAAGTETVSLVVKPSLPAPQRGRDMLGAQWASRGTTLRWRVDPGKGPGSGSVDH